jgi:hypothetical protein
VFSERDKVSYRGIGLISAKRARVVPDRTVHFKGATNLFGVIPIEGAIQSTCACRTKRCHAIDVRRELIAVNCTGANKVEVLSALR